MPNPFCQKCAARGITVRLELVDDYELVCPICEQYAEEYEDLPSQTIQ